MNDYDIKELEQHLESNNGFAKWQALKALSIIKRLKAENEELKLRTQNLTSENENLISDLKSAKAEIGRIRSELASWQINIHNDIRRNDVVKKLENKCNMLEFVMIPELVRKAKSEIRKAVSEAYREFAERLKCGVPQETGVIRCKDVDFTLAELTERKEDRGK